MTYACTVEISCTHTFDKYVDWCTHEIMAHKKDWDVWICNERSVGSACSCNIGFRTELEFEEHPAAKHNEPFVHSNKYALGPKAGSFYCGFCRSMLSINKDDMDQWMTARLKHISAHLEAGCSKGDWAPLLMHWVFTEGVSTKKDLQFTAHSTTL
jgi:hypothetical protein